MHDKGMWVCRCGFVGGVCAEWPPVGVVSFSGLIKMGYVGGGSEVAI